MATLKITWITYLIYKNIMKKNCKQSSSKLASKASQSLRSKATSKGTKSLAGSVLSQATKKKKR